MQDFDIDKIAEIHRQVDAVLLRDWDPIGVANVAGLNIEEFRNLPVTLTSLEGESPEERIARRVSRWTPMTLSEPN